MTSRYVILFLYFVSLFLIGYLAAGKIKDIKDYYVGGKRLGYWVAAFSSRATGASAWVLLGLTGMGAVLGVSAFWMVLGTFAGEFIAWFFMAEPFKRQSDALDSITIPDYLVSRLRARSHLLRAVSAAVLCVFVIIYVSAQIDATGTAFEAFLGWNYFTGAIVGFLIVVLYMSFGGFIAVAWSDVFQGVLMLAGLVALPLVAWLTVTEAAGVMPQLERIDPGLINLWGSGGFTLFNLTRAIGFLMIGLGYLGSPQLFVRYMSVRSTEELRKGKWVAITLTLLMNGSAVAIGILGRVLLTTSADAVTSVLGNGGQDVLILLADQLLPATLSGLYIAAVLAAIMSTIDSLLVVASSAVTRDFYQKIFHPQTSNRQLAGMSKVVTVVLSVLALVLALSVALLSPQRTIFWFVIFGWSGIAATFCPVMLLSLYWKKYTDKGAVASMLAGLAGVPFFKFAAPHLPGVGVYFQNIAELLPAFVLALLTGYIVSLITYPSTEQNE